MLQLLDLGHIQAVQKLGQVEVACAAGVGGAEDLVQLFVEHVVTMAQVEDLHRLLNGDNAAAISVIHQELDHVEKSPGLVPCDRVTSE